MFPLLMSLRQQSLRLALPTLMGLSLISSIRIPPNAGLPLPHNVISTFHELRKVLKELFVGFTVPQIQCIAEDSAFSTAEKIRVVKVVEIFEPRFTGQPFDRLFAINVVGVGGVAAAAATVVSVVAGIVVYG